jgi:hypothetical protein
VPKYRVKVELSAELIIETDSDSEEKARSYASSYVTKTIEGLYKKNDIDLSITTKIVKEN